MSALVSEWLINEDHRASELLDITNVPALADAVAGELIDTVDLEQAIAESERRLEVERLEREVLTVLRSFAYPPGLRLRLLDQEPTPDEVVRWASTVLHDAGSQPS